LQRTDRAGEAKRSIAGQRPDGERGGDPERVAQRDDGIGLGAVEARRIAKQSDER
jgi:hypothetical protein